MRRRPLALALVLIAGAARAAAAQGVSVALAVADAPPRPALTVGSDTNDAGAYYRRGRGMMRERPDSASQFFHWASRLDPTWADPLFDRAVAVLSASGKRQPFGAGQRNWRWVPDGKPGPRQVEMADSLARVAFGRDPFLRRWGDAYIPLDRLLQGRLPSDDVAAGYAALALESFDTAATRLGRALARRPGASALRVARAHALYHLARHDSAVAELSRARADVDSLEATAIVTLAQQRAALHYALGRVHAERGDTLAAREAFEAVLVADLTYPMARVRRAALTLSAGDTAAALADLAQEVEVRGDDAFVRLLHAQVLDIAGRTQAASGQLLAAMGLAPEYAAPYLAMARLYDRSGDARGAVEWYDEYLRRAARRDPLAPGAAERVAQIRHRTP